MKKKKIIIVGGGQNGFVIKGILEHDTTNQIVGFLDDKLTGPHILGTSADFGKFPDHAFFVAIGTIKWRRETYELLKKAGVTFINAIHPTAFIEKSATIGENVMVGAFSYLNVGSSVGNDVLINNGCIVEHDCSLGDHSDINPGVVMGGGVTIGNGAFIGLGAKLRDHISIGENAIVGMGTVVLKDVPPGVVFHNRLETVTK